MQSARLIYNPAAGRFPARPLLDRAVRVLADAGWAVEVFETTAGQDLPDLAAEAVAAGCDAVFVAGGDGSVGRVASRLAGTKTALGVLPAGTANVWARDMGLPALDWAHWFALEDAAARLAGGSVRKVDIGWVGNRAFLLWSGIGLDGQIVNSIEPRERWEKAFGSLQYGVLALWSARDWTGMDLRVRAGERQWEDHYLVAIASNIRSYAGGLMELSPSARIDDGLLDFWLIGGRSLRDAVVRVVQVLLGMHVDSPEMVHFTAARASFEAASPLPMQFDGEPAVLSSPVEFRVEPRVLRVLVPKVITSELFSPNAGPRTEA